MRRPSAPARFDRSRGFSLLEVLVAFVILALVATALFGLFSGALGNASASEDWSRAMLFAESRLAAAANPQTLQAAVERGSDDEGRVKWETRVTAWEAPGVDPELARLSETMATGLYRIEVDVSFPGVAGGERKFSLATVKLALRESAR